MILYFFVGFSFIISLFLLVSYYFLYRKYLRLKLKVGIIFDSPLGFAASITSPMFMRFIEKNKNKYEYKQKEDKEIK